ncbi:putative peptidase Do [Arabidopsis thaliana]
MREQKEKSLFHSLCEDVEKHKGISVPMRRFRLKSPCVLLPSLSLLDSRDTISRSEPNNLQLKQTEPIQIIQLNEPFTHVRTKPILISLEFESLPKTIDSVATESVLNSVVKINTFSSKPNICYPWQNKPQKKIQRLRYIYQHVHAIRILRFVIPGKMIITNAHVVANHILVLVIKRGSPKKYKAEVKAIGRECDLAILVIESKEFWEDMNPLELGDMPFLQESVNVIGYPTGGENISVTKGVVSRIESMDYAHGAINLPAIQTDAAMNPGNSGGPVCIGNKVVGVAFQTLGHSNNIGCLIPAPVVKHFITGVEKTGQYVGFCSLNLSYQHMDAQIRSHFKMNSEMTGILIYNINQHSDALNILKKYDVILSIDGVAIENDGTVIIPNRERIRLDDLISLKQLGETILLKILREGKMHEFNITLKPVQRLVPAGQIDNNPSYYIFAGFVFVPLRKGSNGEQIVIISEVLADVINVEYYMYKHLKVNSVNKVKDLRLELGDGRVIILDYQFAKSSTSLILERHRVPWAMSKDLMTDQSTTCSSTRLY